MIPLRDTIPSLRTPVVTYALIVANVGVFLQELSHGANLDAFLLTWGLVPKHFSWATVLTSMFLHGGWMHLILNMLTLHIFGDNVEDRLGRGRYLLFYVACGAAAAAGQALSNPHSGIPMVGASGAIAGVCGAYFLFFPRARVVTLVPVFVFIQVVEIPAVVFLLLWFVLQVLSGLATLGARDGAGGVAFWAHVAGFVAGLILGPVMRRRPTWDAEAAWRH